ncbi:MAG: ribonuclease R [Rhodothermales bacterium]
MSLSRKSIRQDVLKLLKNNGNKVYRPKEIAKKLGYNENRDYREFRDVLAEMDEHGAIGRVKGGRYTFKPRATKIEGTLEVNPQGFGFVDVPGQKEDVFVRRTNMGTAIDGDLVRIGLAAPSRGDRQREAEVLEILERRRTRAVGTFTAKGHFGFVEPDDRRLVNDIYVAQDSFNGAKSGDKVVVSIDRFDDPRASPEGRVLDVLGSASDPAIQVLSLALSLNVQVGFPEDVLQEAGAIETEIPASEIERRLDLRAKRTFTIDPEDAKDFDDSIHIESLPNGNLEIGVHIADVSHYVGSDTTLDSEAFKRGTSVYLVDRVVPMLPEKLSNEVCSLRPGEDKLTFSCIMEVSPRGTVKSYRIEETVIRSGHRFSYEEAQDLLMGGHPDHPFASDVIEAGGIARTLTKKRMSRGSVDFDLPEIKIVLDKDGHPADILRKERLEANRLIEELMLLANRTIAEHVEKTHKGHAFVFRVHDVPNEEKISQLAQYVKAFGYRLPLTNGKAESKDLNNLLQHVQGSPEEFVIEDAALRAMAKAVYATENSGHYGLGFKAYTHFTSPIRRYPDLLVHRLLKRYAQGGKSVDKDSLEASCVHCSERERVAVEAERESVKLKQVEYIREHIGERFDGVVTGVTKFGIIVRLSGPLVEGLVHVRDMDDDHYVYDEHTYSLVGDYTGKTYRPGDKVSVKVVEADVDAREVDLVIDDQ